MPIPTDTLLSSQWHLGNSGGLLDLNVRAVWNPTQGAAYTGAGIRVVVIDDGFDYNHPDIAPNYDTGLDFDWDALDNGSNGDHDFDPFGLLGFDPFGNPINAHGTAVTGIIAADDNGTGAVGVAFDASIVGYRTHGFINDGWLQDVRDSIHHAALSAQGDVANISQGIANVASSVFGTGFDPARFDEIEASIGSAVNNGRGGLGMTIVKSAGNSRFDNYDVNADDWTNDTRQVVVGAVDQNGFVSSYSSYGAALLVSGFGTPGEVVTTDRVGGEGYDPGDFTSGFNGTSAAAPMVTGVVSLMYDAEAGLGWRDVQSILANSARHVGTAIGGGIGGSERYAWGWNAADTWNGGGMHFSNDYGYGLVDAHAAVRLAETWLLTGAAQTSGNEFINTMDMLDVATVIPDADPTGLTFNGTAGFDDEVDRVTVTVSFSTTFTADVDIFLTSPNGTVSNLITDTGLDTDFNGTWTFESQAFRGERAAGNWSVRIADDAGADVLTVSDIVVRTFGRDSVDDRYVYTNEYASYAGLAGHGTTLIDGNGGIDTINASAVTSNSVINLNGVAGSIAGQVFDTGAGTVIENAIGGDGNDVLRGNAADNLLHGMRGADVLAGLDGDDTVRGGDGDDSFSGGFGNDLLFGDAGNDAINDGANVDVMDGGAGNDVLRLSPDAANDTLLGGLGIDLLDLVFATSGVMIGFSPVAFAGTANGGGLGSDAFTGIERISGSGFGDIFGGSVGGETLFGNGGNDALGGGAGDDVITGGVGNDTINDGAGIDFVSGGSENDTFYLLADATNDTVGGDAGTDTLSLFHATSAALVAFGAIAFAGTASGGALGTNGFTGIERILAGNFGDTIAGGAGAETFFGRNGGDTLNGWGGDDTLNGEAGSDTLNGGVARDILSGGADADRFVFAHQAHSPAGALRDIVGDFSKAQLDKIDVSLVDAMAGAGGNNAFTQFIGAGGFTAEGQIRATQSGANTLVDFNTAAGAAAEMSIILNNFTAATLTLGDFIV